MKRILLLQAMLAVASLGFAQKGKKEKVYEKVYYQIATQQIGDLTFKVDDAVAVEEELKMKLVISNTSLDYYLFKAAECVLVVDGKEYACKEKPLTIDPMDRDYKVINFVAPGLNKFKNFTLKIGGIYKIPALGQVLAMPDFQLPPLNNFFQAGPFRYELVGDKRTSSGSEFKFNVTYTGDKAGIVRPVHAGLKMPTGKEFPNEVSSKKCLLLEKNESGKIKLQWASVSRKEGDQQYCKMQIIWNAAAMESPIEKQNGGEVNVDWDEPRTTG